MKNRNQKPRPSRIRRAARWVGRAIAVVALALMLYGCYARHALRKEILSTPRDPETGVVIGTEAIDIDPPWLRDDGNTTTAVVALSVADPAPAANGNFAVVGVPAGFSPDRPTSACLLLHGWIGSRKDFADLGERLAAAGYHVRMARLPGHGTIPTDFTDETPETMIEGVGAEYRVLRAKYAEVNVIGFSMGGTLATLLAARVGDVDRLILVAPYFRVTYRWFYILPAEAWDAALGWTMPYLLKPKSMIQVNRPEARDSIYSYGVIPRACVRTLMRLGEEARRPETLSAIHCPVLLVMAEGDKAASPRAAQKAVGEMGTMGTVGTVASKETMAAKGSKSPTTKPEIHLFPKRSNHHLLWDYDAEEAKAAVMEFLAGSRNGDEKSLEDVVGGL